MAFLSDTALNPSQITGIKKGLHSLNSSTQEASNSYDIIITLISHAHDHGRPRFRSASILCIIV
jgi:hypothetical protein